MGKLTTHVLDTATGKPAAGIGITLYRLAGSAREKIAAATTNADGRVDAPLMEGGTFRKGRYELEFEAGVYFTAAGLELPDPPFLEDIILRFGIADEGAHYHVPLLLSPYGYSTYRGS
ncbi:MAG: hydroxyisourate hydrolase [Alphaproteobacteria bacterium]|nr:MAG: hydroxyisourate hydrolase [Alphaproteobacteria bacterium]